MDLELPDAGEQNSGVVGIHGDVRGPGVFVHEQHTLPAVAAVLGPEHAALRLWAVAVSLSGGKHDVGIGGVDDDTPDPTSGLEPHVLPGLATVGALVDAVAEGDVAADEALSRPGPDDVGVGGGHRQGADGGDRLIVENRLPVRATVGALEDPSGGPSRVVDLRVARHTDHRGDTAPLRPDETVGELLVLLRRDPLGRSLRERRGGHHQRHRDRNRQNATRCQHRQPPCGYLVPVQKQP